MKTTKPKVELPAILKKFQKLSKHAKPLYTEAYKIMAASTEVIKV